MLKDGGWIGSLRPGIPRNRNEKLPVAFDGTEIENPKMKDGQDRYTKPARNSLNCTLRAECLDPHWLGSLAEATHW